MGRTVSARRPETLPGFAGVEKRELAACRGAPAPPRQGLCPRTPGRGAAPAPRQGTAFPGPPMPVGSGACGAWSDRKEVMWGIEGGA